MDHCREQLVARWRRGHRKWFIKWRQEGKENPLPFSEFSDSEEGEDDDCSKDDLVVYSDSCFNNSNNELRVFVGTWNVAGKSPSGSLEVDLDEWLNLKDAADIYVLGFQEIVPLKTRTVIGAEDSIPASKWNSLIGRTLNNSYGRPWLTTSLHPNCRNDHYYVGNPNYESASKSVRDLGSGNSIKEEEEPCGCSDQYMLMASKKMVGVFLSVWMKKELLKKYCVSNVKLCSVACGIMGYLGNKGSVSVSIAIEGTSFCFIAAHLASGEKSGDELRRNYQVSEIFRRTSFPRLSDDDDNPHPLTILGHELCLEDSLARKLVHKKDWRALQEFDQLRKEREYGGVFQGWREGSIEFAPTYKYSSSNCNRYSGGFPNRSGEKIRTPAWCDRILWYGKGVKQLSYFRSESKFSDHRPVSALFSTRIEVIKSINHTVNLLLPSVLPPDYLNLHRSSSTTNQHPDESQGGKTTLLKLLVKDMEASPSKDPSVYTSLASSLRLEHN